MRTKYLIAELLFAPDQHPNSIELVVAPSLAEMREILEAEDADYDPVPEAGSGPTGAACVYDFDAKTKHGFVIFAEENLTPSLMVHELSHAAQAFIQSKVMTAKQVKAKSEEDQLIYFDEVCATVTELLCEQAFEKLFIFTRRVAR